jgi:DNA repair exonuclease SbcCD ATPase subunit
VVIDLDVPPGLYLFSGANGAGKSSFWEAVFWSMYGETASGLKSPDLASWVGGKLYSEVEINDKVIRRQWNPNKIYIDGVEKQQSDLDVLAGYPSTAYQLSVYSGQESESFLDIHHKDRTDLLTSALNLEFWSSCVELCTSEVSGSSTDLKSFEVEVAELRGSLGAVDIEALNLKAGRWEGQHTSKVYEVTKEVRFLEIDSKETIKRVEAARKEVGDPIEGAYMLATSKKDEILCKLETVREESTRLEVTLEHKSKESEVLAERLGFFQANQTICPACQQHMDKAHQKKHVSQLEEQIDILGTEIQDLYEKKSKKTGESVDLRNDFNEIQYKIQEISEDRRHFSQHITDLSSTLLTINASLAAKRAELIQLEKEVNPYLQDIAEALTKKRGLHKKMVLLQKKVKVIEQEVASSMFWQSGFRKIRLELLESALAQMTVITNSVLSEVGLGDFIMEYAIDKETKSKTIANGLFFSIYSRAAGKKIPWTSISGGEKQRSRLAAFISLQKVLQSAYNSSFDFEVWDEPTGCLTDAGVEEFLELLRVRAVQEGKRIFLIEHRNLDFGGFSGMYQFNNPTRLQTEVTRTLFIGE